MIVSLNIQAEHGCPGWVNLEPPAKTLLFRTNTNEKKEAYLGNLKDNGLPKGYAVNKSALQKPDWIFSKRLYLTVISFMIQSNNGEQYHHSIDVDQVMVFRGITHEKELYAYMVVERSTDPRYRYWPVLVKG